MLEALRTLNITSKRTHTPEEIEKEFELTRANYLKEMEQVKQKYAAKLLALTASYGKMCG